MIVELLLTGCNLLITSSHDVEFFGRVEESGFVELYFQKIKLLHSQVLSVGFVLLLFAIDVVADIVDLALSLLNRGVELHGLLSRMLQILLQVRDLARQFSLGS